MTHIADRGAPRRGATPRKGSTMASAAVALVVMLGMTGLALDFGAAYLGLQQCQTIADAGALAGSQELPEETLSRQVGVETATMNIPPQAASEVTVTTTYYGPGDDIPDVGAAPLGGALTVTARKNVPYLFLPVLGFQGTTVQRSSTATKVITGTCIAPIWIWHTTPVEYGVQINLLMADAPHVGIPGSFGFLQPQGGVDFQLAMAGLITPDEEELQRVNIGDYVWAYTGLAVDHWRGPLKKDSDSRLNRAEWEKWEDDTFLNYHADNPRILIVPMVEYIAGTGSGAHFVIHKFGAFWLEDVITNGNHREIQGRFLNFTRPGGTLYGLKPGHLVR